MLRNVYNSRVYIRDFMVYWYKSSITERGCNWKYNYSYICEWSIDLNFCVGFQIQCTLREKILAGRKFSAKSAKLNSFFEPRKNRFAKINAREIFQNWWFANINSREIFQELMKCEYWSFCLIQCVLETIGNFVICISKKVLVFTEIVLKTIN